MTTHKPPLKPIYRYRAPMKATPVSKIERGPGPRRKRKGSKRKSVFVKYQTMR
jgi:hypothetical protein